jgi:DUF35 OB-fold domain, acyl-CoA-associated
MRRVQALPLSSVYRVPLVRRAEIGMGVGRGPWHRAFIYRGPPCQPAFKPYTPYLVLLVELDAQTGKPTKDEGLRVIGNLTRPDGVLAPKSEVERVGIGSRVRMVFTHVAPGLALPQWTIDESAAGTPPWRYRG